MNHRLKPRILKSNALLFPDSEDRLIWEQHLTALLSHAALRIRQGPVAPVLDMKMLNAELAVFDFREPVDMEDLFAWIIAQMETGIVQLNHPRYLGLFNPAPSFPAQCADRIAALFNPQLASATTSPAAVAIEAHVIRAVAKQAGLKEDATGHFTSGGSEANFTALVCALTASNAEFTKIGSRAFAGQPVFYISQDSHLAWIKIAQQAGIGRDAARMVPTDGIGRMRLEALKTMIAADRQNGCIPFMLVATAGTTNAGMIDPLEGCGEAAREAALWYHVDAAWGGAAIASPQLRGLLAGIETSDSITIDAHKWFATTMGCGMFLTAHPKSLSAAFSVAASFMPSQAVQDPYMTTAQWSRRFIGLRLFMSLAACGWAGHAAHVERAVELARHLAESVEQNGWQVVNWPALAVVCMVPPSGSLPATEIVRRVTSAGTAWISVAAFEGRDVIRACITNGETSLADIAEVAAALEQARR